MVCHQLKWVLKNTNKTIFNISGRSYEFDNLFCLDSSILPSSTIESPQGTIMAMAQCILDRSIN